MIHLVILGLLAVQRAIELGVARAHTRRLLERGGRLAPDAYAAIVAVHVLFFVLFVAEAFAPWATTGWWTAPLLVAFIAAQALRYWAIMSLGGRWTTRVVVLEGPLVARGPYRFLRHPNYLAVSVELVALPAAFGLWSTAFIVGVGNALALAARIRREDAALASRGARAAAGRAARGDARGSRP